MINFHNVMSHFHITHFHYIISNLFTVKTSYITLLHVFCHLEMKYHINWFVTKVISNAI